MRWWCLRPRTPTRPQPRPASTVRSCRSLLCVPAVPASAFRLAVRRSRPQRDNGPGTSAERDGAGADLAGRAAVRVRLDVVGAGAVVGVLGHPDLAVGGRRSGRGEEPGPVVGQEDLPHLARRRVVDPEPNTERVAIATIDLEAPATVGGA